MIMAVPQRLTMFAKEVTNLSRSSLSDLEAVDGPGIQSCLMMADFEPWKDIDSYQAVK